MNGYDGRAFDASGVLVRASFLDLGRRHSGWDGLRLPTEPPPLCRFGSGATRYYQLPDSAVSDLERLAAEVTASFAAHKLSLGSIQVGYYVGPEDRRRHDPDASPFAADPNLSGFVHPAVPNRMMVRVGRRADGRPRTQADLALVVLHEARHLAQNVLGYSLRELKEEDAADWAEAALAELAPPPHWFTP